MSTAPAIAARAARAPRSKPLPATAPALSAQQIGWLGALLIAAQAPHLVFIPLWTSVAGLMLVVVRLLLLWADTAKPAAAPRRLPSWMLALVAAAAGLGVRWSFGYFLGRDPCVAFLFMLVGIKFLEARTTRDGTVLACLASFLFVTPFFYSQSLFAALAVVPAVLLIGATLEMMARSASASNGDAKWWRPIVRALRLLLQGVPLAAILFVLFPRLAAPLWGLPSDHTASTGLSDKMSPGSISELSITDGVAFRVDFEGAIPPRRQRYWRGPVLTRFDGQEWSGVPQRLDGALATGNEPKFTYTVTLEPHEKPWLFALELPASLPKLAASGDDQAAGGDIAVLTRTQQLISRNLVSQSLRYQQVSILRDRYAADAAHETSENLRLPRNNPVGPRTIAFAQELRAQYPGDLDLIGAVLRWFRTEPFVYTLAPPLLEHDPIDEFLFETRRGFCEHYAGAFVFLLRAAGIPARVVTGYQGGEINRRGGYMIVRQSDAHAWAEALIDGEWRRFDPTAAVSPSRIEMGLGGSLPSGEPVPYLARLDESWLKSVQLTWDAVNHDWQRNVIGFNYNRQRSLLHEWKLDRLDHWQYMALVGAVAIAWIVLLLVWLLWRRNRADRARARWNALCARLARAGLPRLPHEGPVAYAARAAAHWPRSAGALTMIGDSYALLRYGPSSAHADDHRDRAALIERFEHAIGALPGASTLRAEARS